MLLLLRSAASGLPAGNAGILLGVNGLAGPQGSASISLDVPAPTSLELIVFATAGISLRSGGIPVGFVSSSGEADANFNVTGFGGFGFVARGDITFGVGGTVGSTLQGIGNASITFAGAAPGQAKTTAGVSLFLKLTGNATISGGTLAPTAATGINFTLNGSAVMGATALGDVQLDIAGTGFPSIVGLATDMRLTFECDEIRTFFRKG